MGEIKKSFLNSKFLTEDSYDIVTEDFKPSSVNALADSKDGCGNVNSKQENDKRTNKTNYRDKNLPLDDKVRNINCSKCGKTFARKDHLDTHVKAKHSGIHDWNCEQCEYSTYRKQNLNSHIKHN